MKFTKIIASAKGLAYKPERHDDGGWEPVLRSYLMAEEALTNDEYERIMQATCMPDTPYNNNEIFGSSAPDISGKKYFNKLSQIEEFLKVLNSLWGEDDWYYQFRLPTEAEYEIAAAVHGMAIQDGYHMTSSCYSRFGQKKDRILKGIGAPQDRGSMNFCPAEQDCLTWTKKVGLRVCKTLRSPAPGVLLMDDPNSPFNKF